MRDVTPTQHTNNLQSAAMILGIISGVWLLGLGVASTTYGSIVSAMGGSSGTWLVIGILFPTLVLVGGAMVRVEPFWSAALMAGGGLLAAFLFFSNQYTFAIAVIPVLLAFVGAALSFWSVDDRTQRVAGLTARLADAANNLHGTALASSTRADRLVLSATLQSGRSVRFILDPAQSRTWTIGRRADAVDLHLESERVSGRHAQVRWTSRGFDVSDLGSTNGTSVDGRAIGRDPVALSGARTLDLAGVTFTIG